MSNGFKRRLLWLLALLIAGMGTARATTFLELRSTYLGDGLFQYRMNVVNDPFFTQATVTGVQVGFTNEFDQSTTTPNWNFMGFTNGYSTWMFQDLFPAAPYEVNWTIQSSETGYKLATNVFDGDAILLLTGLNFASIYPGSASGGVFSQNVTGCAGMQCLVPCAAAEADGSPTNFVYDLKLAPDVVIKQLIVTNGEIHGVDFQWDSEATFVLQGGTDFKHWTNIAYIWSEPSETLWTTNLALNTCGSYFRLELVNDGHSTNVTPLVAQPVVVPKIPGFRPLTITSTQWSDGNIVVGVSSNPGVGFKVQALDSHLAVQQSQTVVSTGPSTSVAFVATSLPNPVFFRAVLQ